MKLALAKQQALDYLARTLTPTGRFYYIRSTSNSSKSSKRYNLIRHAGTLLCMLEQTQVSTIAMNSALNWLLDNRQNIGLPNAAAIAIVENGEAKLGATALTLAALLAQKNITSNHLAIAIGLANHLVSQQDDAGWFRSILGLKGNSRKFESLYYPGEAILALTRAAAVLQDTKYRDAAFRGATYLANRYANLPFEELPADHWLMLAIRELDEVMPSSILRETVIRLGEAIVTSAIHDEPGQTAHWGNDARLCPAATRAEGLAAAIEIALRAGRIETAFHMLQCLEQAVVFCLAHQIDETFMEKLSAEKELLGGFVHSATKHVIRIDYVQHAIGAISGLLRVRELLLIAYGLKIHGRGAEC